MSRWKATLPRLLPNNGSASVVLAYKMPDGTRMEFSGVLPVWLAQHLMNLAIKKDVPVPAKGE